MSSCMNSSILTFQINTSLQANPKKTPENCRKTLSFPFLSKIKGSMTIEAAIALPLFIFFMVNILSLFLTYERYSTNLSKLHQTAKITALAAHATSSDEVVKLKIIQPISPIVATMGFKGSSTIVTANVRKWTGFNALKNSGNKKIEEEYVYITETGTVYHRSRDCSHLKISIKVVDANELGSERNSDGAKYYSCERCRGSSNSGLVFITGEGNKYHSNASCSGLKRTIKVVKLSEVGGRGPCSGCAY